jgi:hypothetical protein
MAAAVEADAGGPARRFLLRCRFPAPMASMIVAALLALAWPAQYTRILHDGVL